MEEDEKLELVKYLEELMIEDVDTGAEEKEEFGGLLEVFGGMVGDVRKDGWLVVEERWAEVR